MDAFAALAADVAPSQASFPTSLPAAFAVAIVALVGALIYIYKSKEKAHDLLAEERKKFFEKDAEWRIERDRLQKANSDYQIALRLEFETKNKELSERMSKELTELVKTVHANEDSARAEFNGMLEGVMERSDRGTDALVKTLEKLTDRVTTANVHPRGGYGPTKPG